MLSVHIRFAKKVNVDLQFSWKSIKQMSLKHNQIGTMVILHLSRRLGFCHFYDQFKCFFFFFVIMRESAIKDETSKSMIY